MAAIVCGGRKGLIGAIKDLPVKLFSSVRLQRYGNTQPKKTKEPASMEVDFSFFLFLLFSL